MQANITVSLEAHSFFIKALKKRNQNSGGVPDTSIIVGSSPTQLFLVKNKSLAF